MEEIKELYDLICKSTFGHKLVEIEYSDSGINFRTNTTTSGTYLKGKILFDRNCFIVYNYIGYDDVIVPVSKMGYDIEVRGEIIADLSDLLLRLKEFSNFSEKRFNDFEEYSVPNNTVDWEKVFVDELINRFGDTKVFLQSCSIILVIWFDETENLLSIKLKNGEVSPRSKILLQETVDGSNYKEILGILDRIYSDFKHDFYDINGLAEQLKNFGY